MQLSHEGHEVKPICCACRRFYRPERTGLSFIEGMPQRSDTPPGLGARESEWVPYKLWSGDVWKCPGCGHELISGTGSIPIAVVHEDGFAEKVKLHGATFQVNDC